MFRSSQISANVRLNPLIHDVDWRTTGARPRAGP